MKPHKEMGYESLVIVAKKAGCNLKLKDTQIEKIEEAELTAMQLFKYGDCVCIHFCYLFFSVAILREFYPRTQYCEYAIFYYVVHALYALTQTKKN